MTLLEKKTTVSWQYWSLGLIASIIAFNSSPYHSVEFGTSAALALLFFWGLLRAPGS